MPGSVCVRLHLKFPRIEGVTFLLEYQCSSALHPKISNLITDDSAVLAGKFQNLIFLLIKLLNFDLEWLQNVVSSAKTTFLQFSCYADDFFVSSGLSKDLSGKYFFSCTVKNVNYQLLDMDSWLLIWSGLSSNLDMDANSWILTFLSFDMREAPWQLIWFARPLWLGSWRRLGTSVLNSGRHDKLAGLNLTTCPHRDLVQTGTYK